MINRKEPSINSVLFLCVSFINIAVLIICAVPVGAVVIMLRLGHRVFAQIAFVFAVLVIRTPHILTSSIVIRRIFHTVFL